MWDASGKSEKNWTDEKDEKGEAGINEVWKGAIMDVLISRTTYFPAY